MVNAAAAASEFLMNDRLDREVVIAMQFFL
jgi:hypothetical protein